MPADPILKLTDADLRDINMRLRRLNQLKQELPNLESCGVACDQHREAIEYLEANFKELLKWNKGRKP